MKRQLTAIVGILMLMLPASAQKRMFLFDEFTPATIRFINHSQIDIGINFDALGQKIYYYEGETLMELTNMVQISNIKVGDRVFVMKEGLLCEVFDREGGPVLVNWKFKNVNLGSKGALGATTQAKVERLRNYEFSPGYTVADWRTSTDQDRYSLEVWQKKNDNTYFISIGGKQCAVKRLKDLYKAFPDKSKELKAYAKANKLTMLNAEDAFKMFDYLNSIK